METRRLLSAFLVAACVYLALTAAYRWVYPPPPPAPAASQPTEVVQGPDAPATTQPTTTNANVAPAASKPAFSIESAPESEPVVLGGDADLLQLKLSPRGAAVESLLLTERVPKKNQFRFKAHVSGNEPCTLLAPIQNGPEQALSFVTSELRLPKLNETPVNLGDAVWKVEEQKRDADGEHVTFATALKDEQGQTTLTVRKTYRLAPGKPLVYMTVSVSNGGATTVQTYVKQDGPIGIELEDQKYRVRRLMSATQKSGAGVAAGASYSYGDLLKKLQADKSSAKPTAPLMATDRSEALVWTSLSNKYFTVITRPLAGSDAVSPIAAAVADLAAPNAGYDPGDLRARLTTAAREVGPGQTTSWNFEIYAGPKDPHYLETVNPAFADRKNLSYVTAYDADQGGCFCVFHPLPEIMGWLLRTLHAVVRNYGVAILLMVVLVKSLLHPLTVFQQKNMYRMQEGMAKLQPKLEAIKSQYPNDPVKAQQEQMKAYQEAGVNPAGMFLGMIPLFIQMPLLGAFWAEVNSAIALRHAPFDGWWIRDLAAPDALITFAGGLTVPVLSSIPWIGSAFTNIQSLNLLPILMGVSMWLQQKYMPKPSQQRDPNAPPPPPSKSGMTPEEQMRQQQMMSYMMTVMFPLMFYTQSAGLNMYWMFMNIFGIVESLVIRKQIKAEQEYRKLHGTPPPKERKPGWFGKFMQDAAKKVEAMQKEMERLKEQEQQKTGKDERKSGKRR